jgi:hypothetical protein
MLVTAGGLLYAAALYAVGAVTCVFWWLYVGL